MSDALRAHHAVLPGLAWLAGLALLQQCARLPSGLEQAGLLMLAMGLAVLAWKTRRAAARALLAALALGLLGFAQGAWRAEQRLAEGLDVAWEGRDLLLVGRIASLPQPIQGQGGWPGWRFEFALESARDPNPGAVAPALPQRLLLSWYGQPGQAAHRWLAGERWQLVARLRQPSSLANAHGFDYELHLFERGLRATGVVRSAERLEGGGAWRLDRWRQRLRDAIQHQVDDGASAGVIAGLSLGDQAAITPADWALFRATGVAHLMSISGLHVTMFAWVAAALGAWLWRRSGAACLRLAAPTAGLWGGVAAALLYALFSGWGVPAQRTVWMLLSLALLRQLGLRWPWPLALLASAVVVTLLDPWAVSQPGFWLSFVAVGLLMAAGEQAPHGLPAQLGAALRGQWVASLGLAPLSLLFFQQVSLVGLLANLLAIPLVSFVITPLALAGSLLPGLWSLAAWCVQGLRELLQGMAMVSWGVWTLPVAPAWAQAGGLLGAALLVLSLPRRMRVLGLAFLLPMLMPALNAPKPGQFELHAPDVGQGAAVLLRTARHSLMYDAGPQYTPGVDAGERVLLPLLRGLGLRQLDVLLLSHRDQDHVGGADSLLAGVPVRSLLSSLEPGHELLRGGSPASRCERGQRWVWDGVQFEVLHPAAEDHGRALKSNALSCVLRISAGGRSALLAGDIEAAQEQQLVAAGGLASEVLMLAHHGSASSSTALFLDAVAPRLAFAQSGYRNRFGHPAPAVLARLQERGIPLHSSPDCGAWRWRSERADRVDSQCQRVQNRRYWQRQPAGASPAEVGPAQEGLDGAR